MNVTYFENFGQDSPGSIIQRYPGSLRWNDGPEIQGWPLMKSQGAGSSYLTIGDAPQGDNLHFILGFEDSGYTTGRSAGAIINVMGWFRLSATATEIILSGGASGTDVVIPSPSNPKTSVKNLYLVIDDVNKILTVYLNGVLVAASKSVADWVSAGGAASTRITTSGALGQQINQPLGLPNFLAYFVFAGDLPQGKILDVTSLGFTEAPLGVEGVPEGVKYTDQGYVEDVDKGDPLEKLPAIYSEDSGSITYDSSDAPALATALYAAAFSTNPLYSATVAGVSLGVLEEEVKVLPPLYDYPTTFMVEFGLARSLELVIENDTTTIFSPRFTDANINVLWGDGTETGYGAHTKVERALQPGRHTIRIYGTFDTAVIANEWLREVKDWGEGSPTHISFWKVSETGDPELRSTRMTTLPNWIPASLTSFTRSFMWCQALDDPNMDGWGTQNIKLMTSAFAYSGVRERFGPWDVSSVENFDNTFANTSFNGPIEPWKVNKARTMTGMFASNPAINRDLSKWCVAAIAVQPSSFMEGAAAWTELKPVWGTCPE